VEKILLELWLLRFAVSLFMIYVLLETGIYFDFQFLLSLHSFPEYFLK